MLTWLIIYQLHIYILHLHVITMTNRQDNIIISKCQIPIPLDHIFYHRNIVYRGSH